MRLHTPTHLLCAVLAATVVAYAGSAQAQDAGTLRVGAFAPPGTPFAQFWAKFKANVERDTAGALKVELNLADANEANLMSNMRRGRVECMGASLQGSATVVPEIAVLQLPYLFENFKQVDHSYDAGLLQMYRKLFAAKGVELLRFAEVGFTHVYGTAPIKSPADVKGVKLRATQARASQVFVRATGAEAVVLPIGEALPALQTGLIKGGESGIVVYSAIISRAANHYTLTNHAFDSGALLCNKEWFDKLTPAQQTAVRNGWDTREQATATRASNEAFLAGAGAQGITVYRPTAAETQQWQAAGRKAAEELLSSLGPEGRAIHAEVMKDLAAVK
jgi:TRAP-type transport system periplasmic protein